MARWLLLALAVSTTWGTYTVSEAAESRQRLNHQFLQAVAKGNTAQVKQLLARGAELNAREKYFKMPALVIAASSGHPQMVRLLLSRGVHVDVEAEGGTRALHEAAAWGHAEVVKILIAHRASVSAKDASGNTALHYASWRARPTVVRLLLDAGAEVKPKNSNGHTPLAMALKTQRIDSAKMTAASQRRYPLATETVRLLKQAEDGS